MKVESKRKITFWPGLGLIIGGAIGILLFIFQTEPIYIPFATGLGLVVGTIIGLVSPKEM